MPVECYPWQVHPSWIGRGWQAILGSVPSEACESEDLCQWSVTPGRSTQAGLVEGDRPYWGQSLWSITPSRSTQAGLVEGGRPDWGQSLTLQVEGLEWDQPTLASIAFHRDGALSRTRISLSEENLIIQVDEVARKLTSISKVKKDWIEPALPLIRLLQEGWWVWMRENGDKQGLLG